MGGRTAQAEGRRSTIHDGVRLSRGAVLGGRRRGGDGAHRPKVFSGYGLDLGIERFEPGGGDPQINPRQVARLIRPVRRVFHGSNRLVILEGSHLDVGVVID